MTGSVEWMLRRRAMFADGVLFGATGAYERIDARAHIALDPRHAAQSGVFNLDLAPRGADGRVHVAADVFILKLVDPARSNGALLFELPNRGNKRCLQFLNDAPASNDPRTLADAGNGFLMRQGYAVACVAWQGDVLPGDNRLTIDLPVAHNADGTAVTAPVRAEFICDTPGVTVLPLSGKTGTRSHPAVSLDTRHAELRRRRYPWTAAQAIAPDRWAFARVEGGGRAGAGDITGAERAIVASDSHIHLPGGFEPGWIYELVYTARDPLVLDLGFAAVREIAAFLRHDSSEANPLRGCVARVHGWGRSQAGRALRDYVHRGFNADAQGRAVFDGVLTHIAGAGRTAMTRFSNLVVAASRQYEDWTCPSDRFPFSYAQTKDHVTGATDALLKRPETDPLVIHTQTASEYWHRRGSLVHTDTQGNDLAQPDRVRIYVWSSSQHWSDPVPSLPPKGVCENFQNIVATSAFFRAMLVLMEGWAKDGVAPPPSRMPRRADGTLLAMAQWRAQFPRIPGVAVPARPNELPFVDYGPDFANGGAIAEPPRVDLSRGYTIGVPAVDADGNDVAGLRAPMVAAPLGTYTGWNLRVTGHGAGALHDFSGSYIPFAESADERALTGDPRPAITERFGNAAAYVAAIRRAAEALAAAGFWLDEDVDRAAAAAASWGRPRHRVSLTDDGD